MVCLRQLPVGLAWAILFFVNCSAFQSISPSNRVTSVSKTTTIPTTSTPVSHLFGNTRIFMTDGDANKEPEETQTETNGEPSKNDKQTDEKRTRTILLTIPLFFKFAIVLLIKIVTDLIVFPLIGLYSLAGLAKRRFLSAIGKGGSDTAEKTNGEA